MGAIILICAVTATLVSDGCHGRETAIQAQKAIIHSFYAQILTLKEGGVPSKDNIDKLGPMISTRFRQNLLAALDAENRHYKAVKNEEPPLIEGTLFYSLYEGANKVGRIEHEDKTSTHSFLVNLEYGDPMDPKQHCKWKDRAILIQENGKWVVDDLELLGEWQFGSKGKLSGILKEVASYGKQGE